MDVFDEVEFVHPIEGTYVVVGTSRHFADLRPDELAIRGQDGRITRVHRLEVRWTPAESARVRYARRRS